LKSRVSINLSAWPVFIDSPYNHQKISKKEKKFMEL